MTKPLPFTELAIRRVIAAAQQQKLELGWSITVHPDGAITIHNKELESPSAPGEDEAERLRWSDVEA